MSILELAKQHRSWLAHRQAAVSHNVANAGTPGFKAGTTSDFQQALGTASLKQAATHASHIAPGAPLVDIRREDPEPEHSTHSGNTVDLAKEFITAGEIRGAYAFNASVAKTFNRMLLAALRS